MTAVISETMNEAISNVRVGDVQNFLHGRGRIRSVANGEVSEFRREDCSAHLQNQLVRMQTNHKPNETVRVLYKIRISGRRTTATDICVYAPETSIAHAKSLALHFLEAFLAWPGIQPSGDIAFFCDLLGRASLLTKSTVQKIADATFAAQRANRINFASCLSQERAHSLAEEIGLEAQWLEAGTHETGKVRCLSELLLSASAISALESRREDRFQELAAERQRVRAEQEEKQREQFRAMRRQLLDDLLAKYRDDPSGLREVSSLAYVCLSCGQESKGIPGKQVCSCGCEWYVNHCWSCLAKVDDRDPANPHCPVCGWCYCAKCRACSLDGCSTNRYNRSNNWRDEQQAALQNIPPALGF
jgi:hypothetical protein